MTFSSWDMSYRCRHEAEERVVQLYSLLCCATSLGVGRLGGYKNSHLLTPSQHLMTARSWKFRATGDRQSRAPRCALHAIDVFPSPLVPSSLAARSRASLEKVPKGSQRFLFRGCREWTEHIVMCYPQYAVSVFLLI